MAAQEWSEKKKMLATLIGGLVINLAIGGILYRANGQYKDLVAKNNVLKKDIDALEVQVRDKDQQKQILEGLKLQVAEKEKMLPEQSEIDKLIVDVGTVADKYKCRKDSLDSVPSPVQDPSLGGNYVIEKWKAKWTANFMQIAQMINEMEERFPRFIAIEGFNLQAKSAGLVPSEQPEASHTINFDLITYKYQRKN